MVITVVLLTISFAFTSYLQSMDIAQVSPGITPPLSVSSSPGDGQPAVPRLLVLQDKIKEGMCTSCLRTPQNRQVTCPALYKCTHYFCQDCLNRMQAWSVQQGYYACPVCRLSEKKQEKLEECDICFSELGIEEDRWLSCNHAFHSSCINGWRLSGQEQANACPTCRAVQCLKVEVNCELCKGGFLNTRDIEENQYNLWRFKCGQGMHYFHGECYWKYLIAQSQIQDQKRGFRQGAKITVVCPVHLADQGSLFLDCSDRKYSAVQFDPLPQPPAVEASPRTAECIAAVQLADSVEGTL